jgi:hypothetical protein
MCVDYFWLPRRTFHEILPEEFKKLSIFIKHIKSLDTTQLSLEDCLMFIAQLAFPSSTTVSATASSSSAIVSNQPSAVIFLGVDEISKSMFEDELLKLVGSISDSMLLLPNGMRVAVLPIVTSLSQSLLAKQATLSNRPLSLVSMPVNLPGAADMMLQKLQLGPEYRVIIDALCRSLGNHGRSLEVLHDLLIPSSIHKLAYALRKDLLVDKESSISRILQAVADDNKGACNFQLLTDDAESMVMPVCHALLGSSIGRSKMLKNCPMKPDQLQMHGVFIGDATSKRGQITPIMSPFQVLLWARKLLKESVSSELNLLATKLVEVLSIQPPISGTDFERFHAGMCVFISHFRVMLPYFLSILPNVGNHSVLYCAMCHCLQAVR